VVELLPEEVGRVWVDVALTMDRVALELELVRGRVEEERVLLQEVEMTVTVEDGTEEVDVLVT